MFSGGGHCVGGGGGGAGGGRRCAGCADEGQARGKGHGAYLFIYM